MVFDVWEVRMHIVSHMLSCIVIRMLTMQQLNAALLIQLWDVPAVATAAVMHFVL